MPIYNSKNIIEFVNKLEDQIDELKESTKEWSENQGRIISGINRIDGINVNAIQSLVKADEALSELSTATFTSGAARGKRLEDTLKKLKESIFSAIENGDIVGVGGGGGELTGGVFYKELNNAISEVDATIEDGLKLDYRLQKIQTMAASGSKFEKKELVLPHKMIVEQVTSVNIKGELNTDERFVDAEVTVLDRNLLPIFNNQNEMITGHINLKGEIVLSELVNEPIYLYYPVQMNFLNIPEDFGYLFFDLLIDKHSPIMSSLVKVQKVVDVVLQDFEQMKGENWTADFSIMSNHIDLLKESIVPKGVSIDVRNGQAVLGLSYQDSEMLSHFVAETLNPVTNEWEPINEQGGIINK